MVTYFHFQAQNCHSGLPGVAKSLVALLPGKVKSSGSQSRVVSQMMVVGAILAAPHTKGEPLHVPGAPLLPLLPAAATALRSQQQVTSKVGNH